MPNYNAPEHPLCASTEFILTNSYLPMATSSIDSPRLSSSAPHWMKFTLRAAAIYNILWGAWCILFPTAFWSLIGMDQPNYPFLWQCIGMIVGVYGVGYWIAGENPAQHWPIVWVGFLGKIFGPIGFIQAHFIDQVVPLRFGVTLLTNDLIWWVPFFLLLRYAYKQAEAVRLASLIQSASSSPPSFTQALASARTPQGTDLLTLSTTSPVLIVFLRHMGCTFCREALADIAKQRSTIESRGYRIALVHMVSDADAAAYFSKYSLQDLPAFSDPKRELYQAFELRNGSLTQLFNWRSWIRGVSAGIFRGHLAGSLAGNGFQMPGAFVLHKGQITKAFRHETAADRPDYCELATSPR